MRASRYNLFVNGDAGCVYAVNLLTRAALELSPEAYDSYLACERGEALDADDAAAQAFRTTLTESLFLVPDDFDELAYIRYRTQQERFDTRQLGLVIAPTLGCNFGCHYCFENKKEGLLSPEAQEQLLRLVATNLPGREHLSVQWFGGEPLLALSVIEPLSRRLIQFAQAAGATYAATVITNGLLMSPDTSALLAQLGVKTAQISLDGDRPLHDRTRREKSGDGSFDTIIENIRQASHHIAVKVRVHVAPFSIESVRQLVETLAAEGMAAHIAELYFAPLFNYRPHLGPGRAYLPDGKRFMTARDFAGVQIDLIERATARGFRVPDPLDASYGICTAVRANTLVVDAEANLLKCYKDVGEASEAIGTLDTGPRASANLLKWMDIAIPRDDECRTCTFLPICLGGCSKQWQEGASKEVICTPLRFNADARLRLHFAGPSTAEGETPASCSA